MTKSVYILLSVTVILVLAACSSSEPEESTPTDSRSEPTLATSEPMDEESELESQDSASQDSEDSQVTQVLPADARASVYIGGNESPSLQEGDAGEISVVAISKPDRRSGSTVVPIVMRNNTNVPVRRVTVSATAYDTDDNLIAVGGDQTFDPNIVQPGEITIGYLYFSDVELADEVRIDVDASAEEDVDSEFENIRNLEVTDHSMVENRIVGVLTNNLEKPIQGPIEVRVLCFDDKGEITHMDANNYTEKDEVEPNGTVPFQVALADDAICPIYLITASGYVDFGS